jgi:hypothetical protein
MGVTSQEIKRAARFRDHRVPIEKLGVRLLDRPEKLPARIELPHSQFERGRNDDVTGAVRVVSPEVLIENL